MHDELNLPLNVASSPSSPCLGDVQWGWCLAVGNRSFFPLGNTKPLCRTPKHLVMAPGVPCLGQEQQDSLHRVPGRHLLYHHKGDLLLPEVREAAQEHLAEEEGPVSACSTLKLFPSPRLRADLLAPSTEQLGGRRACCFPARVHARARISSPRAFHFLSSSGCAGWAPWPGPPLSFQQPRGGAENLARSSQDALVLPESVSIPSWACSGDWRGLVSPDLEWA